MLKISLLFITIIFFCVLNVFAQKDIPNVNLDNEQMAAQEFSRTGIHVKINVITRGYKSKDDVVRELFQDAHWSHTLYNFSDNTRLSFFVQKFETPNETRKAFEKQLKSAVKIIKQEVSTEKEIILAIFESKKKNAYEFAKVVLYNNMIEVNQSKSLKHLLAFELIKSA